jgi:anthranilate phosphoribosyltransferase
MTDAYVNIMVEPGAVSAAAAEIRGLESVGAAHTVTGEFDVIAQLELESKEQIPEVVADDIHGISGVLDTVTNVAFEG